MNLQKFADEFIEVLKNSSSFEQIDITVQRILTAQIDGSPVNSEID